jgi:hypothetical protein
MLASVTPVRSAAIAAEVSDPNISLIDTDVGPPENEFLLE